MTPTPEATYERAYRLANIAMWTISLQCRRLRTVEPEDGDFVFRRWADLGFLVVALTRLQRAATVATSVPQIRPQMKAAIEHFKAALPGVMKQRNVAEHIDEYAIDSPKRHDKTVDRKQLESSAFDGDEFEWLGEKLSLTTALAASEELFRAIRAAGALLQGPA